MGVRYSRFVKPIEVLFGRLTRDSASGGIVDGLNVYTSPVAKIDGVDDLPQVILMEYTDREEIFDGAKTGSLLSTSMVRATCTAFFLLSFDREAGAYSTTGEKPFGCLDWAQRFKDCLETDDGGALDLMLNGTCVEPMVINTGENEVRDLTWSMLFEVEYYPMPFARGSRHHVWLADDESS